ncbi:MAG: hypothetical protein JJ956_14755 [Pseudomonadales bacterium]|nr:hypothetical protein [Pseudomonadales bacterium]
MQMRMIEIVVGAFVLAGLISLGILVTRVSGFDVDGETDTYTVCTSFENVSVDSTASILTEGLLGGKCIGLSIGAEEDFLVEGSEITDTQSAIVLEELIGQFLLDQF